MRKTRGARSTFSLTGWLFADLLLGLSMIFFLANSRGVVIPPITTAKAAMEPTSPTPEVPTPVPTAAVPTPKPPTPEAPTPVPNAEEIKQTAEAMAGTMVAATAEGATQIGQAVTETEAVRQTNTPTPEAPTAVEPAMNQAAICYEINTDIEGILAGDPAAEEDVLAQLEKVLPDKRNVRVGMVIVWGYPRHTAEDKVAEGLQMAKRVNKLIEDNFTRSFRDSASKSLYGNLRQEGKVLIELYLFSGSPWHNGLESSC